MNNIQTENTQTHTDKQPTAIQIDPMALAAAKAKRERLLAILHEFDVPVDSFDALRSDSYEKHLAQRSLTELEMMYVTLLNPGKGCEGMPAGFPRWGKGSKHEGKEPSEMTLTGIKRRVRAEHIVDKLEQSEGFMDRLKNQLAAGRTIPDQAQPGPIIQNQPDQPGAACTIPEKVEAVDVIISLMTEELLAAKLDGKGLSPGMLDRVLRAMNQRTRNRLAERKLALQERAEQRELEREQRERAEEAARQPREVSQEEYERRYELVYGEKPSPKVTPMEGLPPVEKPGAN